MRAILIVPIGETENLLAELIASQRDKDFSSAFILNGPDRTLNYSDAAVLANGPISRRLDVFAFDPLPESAAVEDRVSVTDNVFWRRIGATYGPS